MISMVLILPASEQANGNAIAVSLGHDVAPGDTYSVSLSATGQEPATHYGCRTWATAGFKAMLDIAKSGVVPDGTAPMLAQMAQQVASTYPATIAALVADAIETDDAYAHWSDVLSANSLVAVSPAEI